MNIPLYERKTNTSDIFAANLLFQRIHLLDSTVAG